MSDETALSIAMADVCAGSTPCTPETIGAFEVQNAGTKRPRDEDVPAKTLAGNVNDVSSEDNTQEECNGRVTRSRNCMNRTSSIDNKVGKKSKIKKEAPEREKPDGDWHCTICSTSGEMFICDGMCGRCYHPDCLHMDSAPDEQWFCDDRCKRQKVLCVVTNQLVSVEEAVRCKSKGCASYVHMDHIPKGKSAKSYRCPKHVCKSCNGTIQKKGKVGELPVTCIICTNAWHVRCAPWQSFLEIVIDSTEHHIGICSEHKDKQEELKNFLKHQDDLQRAVQCDSVNAKAGVEKIENSSQWKELQSSTYEPWLKVMKQNVENFCCAAYMTDRGGGNKPVPFTKVRRNVWRVPQLTIPVDEQAGACDCKCPSDGSFGCKEDCINRVMHAECLPTSCPCKKKCGNQRLQKHQYANLRLFRSGDCGFGMKAGANIKEGDLVQEYQGEVVSSDEMHQRLAGYLPTQPFYFFCIDANHAIDASAFGSMARFINHSCEPNCHTEKWSVGKQIRIAIIASRDISKGEEVTYDYQFEWFGECQQKCYCGSKRCRGVMGTVKNTASKQSKQKQ